MAISLSSTSFRNIPTTLLLSNSRFPLHLQTFQPGCSFEKAVSGYPHPNFNAPPRKPSRCALQVRNMVGHTDSGEQQRTVLITGVSRGLGKALALELAKLGHTIIGCSRSLDNFSTLRTDLDSASNSSSHNNTSRHLFIKVDVKSDSSVQQFARAVIENKLVPDIIVNNAGTINKNNRTWEVPVEEFDNVIDTNVKGVANIMRHFIPLMIEKKQGIVVNMSSGWGRSAAAQVAPYCASKWAVEGLSRSAAKEVPPGIAIVALSPGVINTEMLQSCFGSSASLYEAPESWAPKAATMILNLTVADNGASLTV